MDLSLRPLAWSLLSLICWQEREGAPRSALPLKASKKVLILRSVTAPGLKNQ